MAKETLYNYTNLEYDMKLIHNYTNPMIMNRKLQSSQVFTYNQQNAIKVYHK